MKNPSLKLGTFLIGAVLVAGVLSWLFTDTDDGISKASYIPQNSFTQQQADWTATSGPTFITHKPSLFSGVFTALSSIPTTLVGYGITDAYPLSGNPSGFLTNASSLAWSKVTGAPSFITGVAWGSITGTLSSQTDLQTALNLKLTVPSGTTSQLIDGTGALQTIQSPPQYWMNGVLQANIKHIMFTGTLTSGTVVFYMTNGGLVGGTGLCTASPQNVTIFVNDPSNIYGSSYAVINSNKTLTVTVNQRNFAGITVVGIPVLGSTSIGSAPNGTPVQVSVDCN